MQLTQQQLSNYKENGFLLIENVFQQNELQIILDQVDDCIENQKNGRKKIGGLVFEENQLAIRTVNGLHLEYDIFYDLCRHPRLLLPAQHIINDSNLYVHQFKINLKEAFNGDVWEWHQDYIYWLKGDGMPTPKAVSVIVLLDEVTEFNGPLMFIPGSHKSGMINVALREVDQINQESWIDNVTAKLRYPAPKEVITKLAKENGIIAPKAPAGSVILFDCNILHASTNNLSPYPRRCIIVTFNPTSNVNLNFSAPRPDFLASRNFTPLTPAEDDIFLSYTVSEDY